MWRDVKPGRHDHAIDALVGTDAQKGDRGLRIVLVQGRKGPSAHETHMGSLCLIVTGILQPA